MSLGAYLDHIHIDQMVYPLSRNTDIDPGTDQCSVGVGHRVDAVGDVVVLFESSASHLASLYL